MKELDYNYDKYVSYAKAIDAFSRTLVGKTLKRCELWEERKSDDYRLLRSNLKELCYEEARNLKRCIKILCGAEPISDEILIGMNQNLKREDKEAR